MGRRADGGGGGGLRGGHGSAGTGVFSSHLRLVLLLPLLLAMAAVPSSATTEAQLRAAILSPNPQVLVVNSDITLTSNLPDVVCPDLTIQGKCRRRLCKIDGRNRYSAFSKVRSITVTGMELTRLTSSGALGGPAPAIAGNPNGGSQIRLANVRISDSRNARGRGVVELREGRLTAVKTVFSGNSAEFGGAIGISVDALLEATDVQFLRNKAAEMGGAISAFQTFVNCTRCVFDRNEAGSIGGAVRIAGVDGGGAVFFSCKFSANKGTGRGSKGGAVYVDRLDPSIYGAKFCKSTFAGNTARNARGSTVTDHVWIGMTEANDEGTKILFCPRRPRTGITIPDPLYRPDVVDTCNGCT
ncbi:hypothetical protein CBR_g6278 [Chara braunii]|uniref:Right handed beta helix domain-containing protein n=1 Tax=Chara braunii TaxID=69332 RepID=A0A388KJD8_CHABU|nr:hypothetical protein CBR_g6278 [Chara braunii]|eukprot:GBG70147.1 hypothetical protein CBR_g6278 [Chara braunii]